MMVTLICLFLSRWQWRKMFIHGMHNLPKYLCFVYDDYITAVDPPNVTFTSMKKSFQLLINTKCKKLHFTLHWDSFFVCFLTDIDMMDNCKFSIICPLFNGFWWFTCGSDLRMDTLVKNETFLTNTLLLWLTN